MSTIQTSTLSFLKDIGKNNNKDWFDVNKPKYIQAKENMEGFMEAVQNKLNENRRHRNV